MLFREIELEPGFICEYGTIAPHENPILEYIPRKDYIDFGVCLSGQMRVNIDGIDNTFITKKDRGIIVYGGKNKANHELYEKTGYKWVNIRLSVDYLEQSAGCSRNFIFATIQALPCSSGEPLYYNNYQLTSSMKECTAQIFNSGKLNAAGRLFLRAKCLELVSYQLSGLGPFADDFQDKCSMDLKIREARALLIKNFREPPTIKEIAKTVGLNDTYLKQIFKEKYHSSIYQYLLSFRMDYAKNLIVRRNLTASEAGYAVGYSSISQFSSAFKKYHGKPPGSFKATLI